MRIGVISDIHSNILAFKAAAACLEQDACDEYFLLGDFVSDTPYTKETMEYLYDFCKKHTCHLLRGNREEYMLTQRKNLREGNQEQLWLRNSASGNLLFAYEQLSEKDLDFFESLPISFVYEKEGYPSIQCCHGSPTNARELLELYGDNTREWLEKIDTDYMICAHTHFPGELEHKGKHYYNAGCVGISIDDCGYAQCMRIDSEGGEDGSWKPTFFKVPYDNKQVVQDIIDRGMSDAAPWFVNSNIEILLTGKDQAAALVELAKKLAGDEARWPHIDEKYFAAAAGQLGIEDYRKTLNRK